MADAQTTWWLILAVAGGWPHEFSVPPPADVAAALQGALGEDVHVAQDHAALDAAVASAAEDGKKLRATHRFYRLMTTTPIAAAQWRPAIGPAVQSLSSPWEIAWSLVPAPAGPVLAHGSVLPKRTAQP